MGRAEVGGRPVIPEVTEVGEGRFRAEDHLFYEGLVSDPTQGRYRVDGGELAAHAMAIAERTHPGTRVQAVRTLFLREGRHDQPTDYEIESLRSGRSMAFATVRASQPERGVIAESQLSLVGGLAGPSHQALQAPDVDWSRTTPSQVDIAEPPVGVVGEVDLGNADAADPVLRAVLPMPRSLPDPLSRAMYVAWQGAHFPTGPVLAPHAGIGFKTKASWYTAVLVEDLRFWRPLGPDDDLRFDIISPVMADGAALVTSHGFGPDGTLLVTCALDMVVRKQG
jgi:acyl-CoA thioesterase